MMVAPSHSSRARQPPILSAWHKRLLMYAVVTLTAFAVAGGYNWQRRPITLNVAADGAMRLNDQALGVPIEDLLVQLHQESPKRPLLVVSARGVAVAHLQPALDAAKLAGIERVYFEDAP